MELDLVLIFGSERGKCVCVRRTWPRTGRRGPPGPWRMPPFVYVWHVNNLSICTAEGKEGTLRIDAVRNPRSSQTRKARVGKKPQTFQVKVP